MVTSMKINIRAKIKQNNVREYKKLKDEVLNHCIIHRASVYYSQPKYVDSNIIYVMYVI